MATTRNKHHHKLEDDYTHTKALKDHLQVELDLLIEANLETFAKHKHLTDEIARCDMRLRDGMNLSGVDPKKFKAMCEE